MDSVDDYDELSLTRSSSLKVTDLSTIDRQVKRSRAQSLQAEYFGVNADGFVHLHTDK